MINNEAGAAVPPPAPQPPDAWERVETMLRSMGSVPCVSADYTVRPMEWCLRIDGDCEVRGQNMEELASAAEAWLWRRCGENAKAGGIRRS